MKKSRFLANGLVVALAAGALSLGVAAPASAHDNTASATCEALTVNAVYYETKPGQGEPTIANPDYKPAVPAVPAVGTPTIKVEVANPDYKAEVPATYETVTTDREYKKFKGYWPVGWWDFQWFPETAKPNPNSGWEPTGQVKTAQVEKTPLIPAVGTPTIFVDQPNPDYKPEVPGVPAVGEPTIPNPAYVAPNAEPNSVKVWIDGAVVEDKFFGANYSNTFAFDNKYEAHDWKVQITAWNDPSGSKGWTKTRTGTSTPCEIPVVAANPQASIEAVCGAADVTLTNPQKEWESNKTASFVVEVDGEVYDAYSVVGNGTETVSLTFDEDSGTHVVEVFQAGTSEYKSIAKAEVPSDCIVPQPEDEVTQEQVTPIIPCDAVAGDEIETTTTVTTTPYVLVEGEWVLGEPVVTTEDSTYVVTEENVANTEDCAVVTPPTEEKPTVKPVAAKVTAPKDGLAQTGLDTAWALTGGAVGVAALALGTLLFARRRQTASMTDSE